MSLIQSAIAAATRVVTRVVTPIAAAMMLVACSDSFDSSQVPRVTVTPVIAAPLVVIRWEPAGAQRVQVYRGPVADGDAAKLVWAVSATGTNSLSSGLEYASNPPPGGTTSQVAKPLERGQPYTVRVDRSDPKGGSTNISGATYRYTSTQTFTIPAPLVIP